MTEKISFLQWSTIYLYFAVLVVWVLAIPRKSEKDWANNPWLPTMTIALLWGVWVERSRYDP
jgi:hypothetical protein